MAVDQNYKGFILLHRSICDHWIWKDAVKLKWWLDILVQCNHSTQQVNIGYQLIECKRGESLFSLGTWASRWRVDINTVRRFFKLLKDDKMIVTENVKKTTRLTVCNYDAYNDFQQVKEKQKKSKGKAGEKQPNSDRQQTIHVNTLFNDKTTNTGKPDINISFDAFWDLYDKKAGRPKSKLLWEALTDQEREAAMEHIPKYKASRPDVQYRKDPERYIKHKVFNDVITQSNGQQSTNTGKPVISSNDSEERFKFS